MSTLFFSNDDNQDLCISLLYQRVFLCLIPTISGIMDFLILEMAFFYTYPRIREHSWKAINPSWNFNLLLRVVISRTFISVFYTGDIKDQRYIQSICFLLKCSYSEMIQKLHVLIWVLWPLKICSLTLSRANQLGGAKRGRSARKTTRPSVSRMWLPCMQSQWNR